VSRPSKSGPTPKDQPEETEREPAPTPGRGAEPAGSAPRYARAGVDLDHDEGFIDEIKEIARPTFRPELLSGIGGFAGLFKTPDRYKDPVLVASTDGVGTKLLLASRLRRYDTIGIDCVAMVVNDIIVQGAEPLIFLDYLAMGELDRKIAAEALRGVTEGCRRAGCALLGGETATMPGVYPRGEIELVGFGVGVVERERVIDGSTIREGDVLLGIASSGFHSNGYSLVRSIVEQAEKSGAADLLGEMPGSNTTLASALLAPTRIYVKPLLNVLRDFSIHGMVHVTGGGFDGNVPRILPKGVRARIDLGSWPTPAVIDWLQRTGEIDDAEMRRVFNCGIGMILAVPREEAQDISDRLQGLGERTYRIGEVERKGPDDPPVLYTGERSQS
jgi:phosphoribosylformylglycinamidine cyclo-ligase